jgi:hypothetical protein
MDERDKCWLVMRNTYINVIMVNLPFALYQEDIDWEIVGHIIWPQKLFDLLDAESLHQRDHTYGLNEQSPTHTDRKCLQNPPKEHQSLPAMSKSRGSRFSEPG